MTFEQFIADYGVSAAYLAIVVITFIEGETIVIVAGLAAHAGYLELQWVMLAGLAGSFSGDQLWYYFGRHWGPKVIAKRLSWQEGAQRVYQQLHRHQYWLILTFRFYYGLRNVTPFVVGSAHIPRLRFFALNLIGAIVWAICFGCAGYLMGEAFRLFMDDYHRYALYLLAALVVAGIGIWIFTLMRHRRKARAHGLK